MDTIERRAFQAERALEIMNAVSAICMENSQLWQRVQAIEAACQRLEQELMGLRDAATNGVRESSILPGDPR